MAVTVDENRRISIDTSDSEPPTMRASNTGLRSPGKLKRPLRGTRNGPKQSTLECASPPNTSDSEPPTMRASNTGLRSPGKLKRPLRGTRNGPKQSTLECASPPNTSDSEPPTMRASNTGVTESSQYNNVEPCISGAAKIETVIQRLSEEKESLMPTSISQPLVERCSHIIDKSPTEPESIHENEVQLGDKQLLNVTLPPDCNLLEISCSTNTITKSPTLQSATSISDSLVGAPENNTNNNDTSVCISKSLFTDLINIQMQIFLLFFLLLPM
ncbi:unnamed protein product [Heterobilharzia americana]|nr:unnamed protein product [Heterobilharzia americana]